ncbi:hypothetical protein RI367_006703 [Sorochytrium milnesiophthora]
MGNSGSKAHGAAGVAANNLSHTEQQCLHITLAGSSVADATAHFDPALARFLSVLLSSSGAGNNSEQAVAQLLSSASPHDFLAHVRGTEVYQQLVTSMSPAQYAGAVLSTFFAVYRLTLPVPAVPPTVLDDPQSSLVPSNADIKLLQLTPVTQVASRIVDWYLSADTAGAQKSTDQVASDYSRLPSLYRLLELSFLRYYMALAKGTQPASVDTKLVLRQLYQDRASGLAAPHLLGAFKHAILSYMDMSVLNTYLPATHRQTWHLAYSSSRDGLSWATFQHATAQYPGAVVLVVRDKGGGVFGAYTSTPLALAPAFQSPSESFVFRLAPALSVHAPSGYNRNFVYFNHGAATLPNGIGFGGQLDYFGLWLGSDFIHGHSRANPVSTTYNSPVLSSASDFVIDAVDCYVVLAAEVDPDDATDKRGVLEKNPELVEFMEMAGKKMYSKDIRAAPNQEDFESQA